VARRPPPRSASPGSHDDDHSGRVHKTAAKKPTPPPPVKKKRDRRPSWEQLDNETDVAYEAFRKYRDMGAGRSTAKVAQALGKSKTLMDRWSSANQWVIRARAFDANEDKEWLYEQRDLRRKAMKRNASAAALAMQKFGQFVMSLDPDSAKPDDMIRLANVAHAIERTALALDAPQLAGVGAGSGAGGVDTDAIAGMTDEDRQSRLQMLLREAQQRLDDNPDEDDDDDEESA
jgi:hypothetical protein